MVSAISACGISRAARQDRLEISVRSRSSAGVRFSEQENLEHAIDVIRVRFGDQALVRGRRLPPPVPWPTGFAAIDRLSGIGGLPRGRVTMVQGGLGSGKTSLAVDLLARGTREHAHVVVIDHRRRRFDPWIPDLLGAFRGDGELQGREVMRDGRWLEAE